MSKTETRYWLSCSDCSLHWSNLNALEAQQIAAGHRNDTKSNRNSNQGHLVLTEKRRRVVVEPRRLAGQ